MATFTYRAITADGVPVAGTETAETVRELLERLHVQGLLVTDLRKSGPPAALEPWLDRLRRPGSRDLALLFRQLATLLVAGIPLAHGLTVLEKRAPHPGLRRALGQVRTDVEEGHALSTALARHRTIFPDLVVHSIHAGETAGALDIVLPRLALHFEKDHALRQRVRSAAVYPGIVAVVSVGAIIFLMIYVVPTLVGIFEGFQAPLPWQTRLLIAVGGFVRLYWPVLLTGVVAAGGAIAAVRRSGWGAETADRLALSLPMIGRITQQVIASRFCRTLATLLTGGVPLLQALELVAQSAGNRVVARAVAAVHDGVRTGGRLGGLLAKEPVFPSVVGEMVAIGEESGSVDVMLDRAADFQDVEAEYALSALATAVEPTLIIAMGVVVGFVVVSMYLPLFELVRVVR